ncbi:MAG: tetratricopeptide repeat protein, partial [Planctomycetota bacterium]|nr:tetratricopeptide repeat protein [Planctomycetota bacterium]
RMILKDMPPRPSSIESGVDKKLDAITLKALAKKPEHRYASAADMAADLDAYLAGESVMARSRGARNNLPKLLGITIAMLALVATGVFATILVLGPRKNITVSDRGENRPGPGKNPKVGPKPEDQIKASRSIKRAKEKIHEARISSDPELFAPLLKEAVTELTLAISLDESLSEALILRGVARALLSERERARKDLQAAGNDPMALFYLSRVIKDGEVGEGDKADKAFADIIHLMAQTSRLPNDSVFVHLAKAFVIAFKNKEPNIALEMLDPLVTRYPDFTADIFLLKGYFQLKLNRNDEALVSFNKVLRIYPNSQSALTNRCQLLMQLSDFSAALRDSERLSKLDPDISAAYAVQAQIHAAKDELPQAIRKFRRYLDLKPDDPGARLYYAKLLSKDGKVSEAVLQAQRAIKQAPQDPKGYRLLSGIYHSNSRRLEGDQVTLEAIKTITKPEIQAQMFTDLISQWVKRQRMDAVEKTCRARMKSHPHEGMAFVLLGQAYLITGKDDEGIELFKEAVKVEPENGKSYKYYIEGLSQLGRNTEAQEIVKTMLARLPGNAEALILAADLALRMGEMRKASLYVKQALASEPSNAKAKLRLISMSLARLEHNEVERLVGELVASEKTPRDVLSEARTMLASSYAQRDRITLALEEASKAMQIDPSNPSPRGMMAKIFFNAKRFKQAYELCKASTKINVISADILDILGRIELLNNRNYEAALKAFKYVLAVRKNDPIAHYFYAVTLKRMGQTDAAKTFVERGLQLDPKCEPLLKLKEMLKKP